MPNTRPRIPTNNFAPIQTSGLNVLIQAGTAYLNSTTGTVFAATLITCAASSTTSIYVDLATATVTSGTSGFPFASWPIATVTTDGSRITGFVDNRPDLFYAGAPLVGFATLSGTTTAVTPMAGTFNQLLGLSRLTFYGGSDTIAIRFGNTATAVDSGNNYNYRWATQAAAGTTFANRDSTADSNNSLVKMAAQDTTLSREIEFSISNTSNKTKIMQMQAATETAGIATLPSIDAGVGQWFNTAGQIKSFQCFPAGGNTFGGSIAFYGSN